MTDDDGDDGKMDERMHELDDWEMEEEEEED